MLIAILPNFIYLGPLLVLGTWAVRKIIAHIEFNRKYRLPNVVPGLPLLGNIHQLPSEDACLHFEQLAKKYGEMFTVQIGGTYWLFLNSRRVASELLEKRAAKYSSRMNLPMGYDLVSNQKRTLLMPYGDLWRVERKIMHQILNVSQLTTFEQFQDIDSRALLYNYLQSPDKWWKAHANFSGSIIMSVVFGRRTHLEDPNMAASLAVSEEFVQFLEPGRALVDVLPFLLKVPWAKSLQPWRWYGDDLYRRTRNIYKKEMDGLYERRRLGTQKSCFMSQFVDMKHDQEFSEDELLYIAGTLMEAGTDTTRVSLHQCVAGALLWPDWVERARKQLDEVCGANAERLPGARDTAALPITRGAVKESVRWKPTIGSTGIPHALSEDDEYQGYKIPAGTVVTYNHWAIANSPDEYDEPERFWPERFLDADLDKPPKGHLGFGSGRRVCVGYNVAVTNMFIALARLLYCFEFERLPGVNIDVSRPLPPKTDGPPFPVKIKVRSEAHRKLIERECKGAVMTPNEKSDQL